MWSGLREKANDVEFMWHKSMFCKERPCSFLLLHYVRQAAHDQWKMVVFIAGMYCWWLNVSSGPNLYVPPVSSSFTFQPPEGASDLFLHTTMWRERACTCLCFSTYVVLYVIAESHTAQDYESYATTTASLKRDFLWSSSFSWGQYTWVSFHTI